MLLAIVPVFLWAESELDTTYKIMGDRVGVDAQLQTEYRSFVYLWSGLMAADSKAETETDATEANETIVTASPMPTKAQQPLRQVASQEKRRLPTATPAKQFAPAEYDAMIDKYATEYGADPDLMKKIAKCESGFNPQAVSSTGAYHGMYQFVAATWVSNRNAMGLDPDPALRQNAEEAIRTAAFKMGRDGYGAWPVCSRI